jgi:predicted cobalt transporter CbtA
MNDRNPLHDAKPESDTDRKRIPRLVWWCVAIGIVAVTILFLLFGLSPWTLLILVVVIACPAVVAWLLLIERGYGSQSERSHK